MASTNAHHDGYELRVRTDEIKSVRTDRVSANLTYEGRSVVLNTDPATAIWQIKRTVTTGGESYVEWANEGQYTAAWDQRASNMAYWPGGVLLDNNFSLDFDGINDYLSLGTASFTAMDIGQAWSMSFWFKANNFASPRCLYGKTTADPYGFYIWIDTLGVVQIYARTNTYTRARAGTMSLATQVWYNLVVTYSGSGNISGFKAYINGVEDATSGSGVINSTFHTGQLATVGARGGSAFFFSGFIDEPSFWSKELTDVEIAELYTLGASAVQDSSAQVNLTNWWRMGDGDTYPTILDQIGTDHGTMVNMTSGDIATEVP